MTLVFRTLVLSLLLTLVAAGTVVHRRSFGNSNAAIFFEDSRRRDVGGGNFQFGETGATSVQTSSGEGGQQTNQGEATAVSTQQEETGPGSNTQVINNQAVIQALQQANRTDGIGVQRSDNQVNITTNQLQQNVNGSLVNVQSGRGGVIIINAHDLGEAGEPGDVGVAASEDALISIEQQTGLGNASQLTNNQAVIQALQQVGGTGNGTGQQSSNNQVTIQASQEQENVNGTLVNVQEGHEGVVIINTNDETGAVVNQTVINDRPIEEETEDSARCRYICLRPPNREIYCCDDGSNQDLRTSNFHDGDCPHQQLPLSEAASFAKCAYDSQCAEMERCCYDGGAQHHVCKMPGPAV